MQGGVRGWVRIETAQFIYILVYDQKDPALVVAGTYECTLHKTRGIELTRALGAFMGKLTKITQYHLLIDEKFS